MKIIKVSNMGTVKYLARHWGRWYVLLEEGGLIHIDPWFKSARSKQNG